MKITYEDLKKWLDEELTFPRPIQKIYLGSGQWEEIKRDQSHPYHYILMKQEEEFLKNKNKDGKTKS